MIGSSKISELKSALIKTDRGEALELVEVLQRQEPVKFMEWLNTGGTVKLMKLCAPYETWSIYNQRTGKLPFFNDICRIDSTWLYIKSK